MPSLHPDPGFDYYYKACKKGDSEAKAVTVDQSPVTALANANAITGLPRDNFEIREISKEEFEGAATLSEPLMKSSALEESSRLTKLCFL
jgi:hypothetical protein